MPKPDHAAVEAAARGHAEARLAGWSAASMPWLAKDVDLSPPDGGPETCGPAVHAPAPKRA